MTVQLRKVAHVEPGDTIYHRSTWEYVRDNTSHGEGSLRLLHLGQWANEGRGNAAYSPDELVKVRQGNISEGVVI